MYCSHDAYLHFPHSHPHRPTYFLPGAPPELKLKINLAHTTCVHVSLICTPTGPPVFLPGATPGLKPCLARSTIIYTFSHSHLRRPTCLPVWCTSRTQITSCSPTLKTKHVFYTPPQAHLFPSAWDTSWTPEISASQPIQPLGWEPLPLVSPANEGQALSTANANASQLHEKRIQSPLLRTKMRAAEARTQPLPQNGSGVSVCVCVCVCVCGCGCGCGCGCVCVCVCVCV